MGTLRRTCATAPRRGPLPKNALGKLVIIIICGPGATSWRLEVVQQLACIILLVPLRATVSQSHVMTNISPVAGDVLRAFYCS